MARPKHGSGDSAPFFVSETTRGLDIMANTPQSKKRIRRNARRTVVNHNRLSRIRTFVKKIELAVTAGDKAGAAAALSAAQPEIAKGVAKGVLHKNTAARKFSRLTKAVTALA
jgi:small subunit ribosomal protein S20